MSVKRPVIERQEGWKRGEIKAVEPQKISLDSLIRSENWERDLDGSMFASPGYETEFTVGLHRQISDMEDSEDARWAGALVDDLVNFQYGFQSRQHEHAGAGALNSTFTRPLAFLGDVFNGTTDQINFRFRPSDISELASVEIRFREGGGDYFTTTLSLAGWADNTWQLNQVLQSAFTTSGTPQWDQIVDMHIISTAAAVDAAGVIDLAFDDFFILRPADAVGEPIWEVHGFERVSTPERYLMVSSGSEIWSYLGAVGTKRQTSLNDNNPVNMIVANDMVIAANGSDNIKRWDAAEATFRDLGVPIPADTIVGTEAGVAGTVLAGTYFFVTVFDMGEHGEGNSVSPASSSVTIATGPDRIDYSVIPIGPPGTVRRLIYRTVDGGGASGSLRLDVIVNNNVDTTAQSDVADANLGATLVQDGNQPLVGSMLVHANRTLFLAGVPGSESSVFYSDTTRAANRTIEQWRSTNEFRLNPDDGDRITGVIYFRRFIYIFKRRSTWILDPIRLGSPVQISTTLGAIGHRCLVDGGSVLYAWSDEHGPLEIQGQSITPIGILESNLEREGPRVGDINGNTRATVGVQGPLITTQADFQAGTLTDTSATEVVGSVTLGRSSLAGRAQTTNLSTLPGAGAAATILNSNPTFTILNNIGGAKDGVVNFVPNGTVWSFGTAGTTRVDGSYTLTLAESKSISKIRLWFGTFAGVGATPFPTSVAVVVQYEASPGVFVSVGTFASNQIFVTPSDANMPDFFKELNFGPVTTQKIRVSFFTTYSSPPTIRAMYLGDLQVFESGFEPAGSWVSAIQNLAQTPASWGRFNAHFLLRPTGSLAFFMRSAATSGELGPASIISWERVSPGIVPDTALIPLNDFVEFQATFTSSVSDETPRLDDLAILFTSAASNFVRPRFESAGILFDRRYWLSAVSQDDVNPTLVWKYQQLLKSWSRHPGFNVSAWTRLSDAFFSGSSVDGRVSRQVKDANGEIIRSHAGNNILCLAETKDSSFSGQDTTHTVLDAAVVFRNEARDTKNLVRNHDFEDWDQVANAIVSPIDPSLFLSWSPSAWGHTGNFKTGQGLLQERDPRHIVSGLSSIMLDWGNPETTALIINQRDPLNPVIANNQDLRFYQDISLLPDTDYILSFYTQKDDGIPMDIFSIQDFRSDGAHEFLRLDGTWGVLVEQFLGDNTDIDSTMTKLSISFKTNATDANHVFYRIQWGYLISSNATGGRTWIDDVTLFQVPSAIGNLHVLPILDGKDDVPERLIKLTGGISGVLDVGVIREGFRIDKALIRNARFRLRHEEPEAKAKVMGLYVRSAREEWRQ